MSTKPAPKSDTPDYDAWLKQEIAEAKADVVAGKTSPAEEVWKELDLE